MIPRASLLGLTGYLTTEQVEALVVSLSTIWQQTMDCGVGELEDDLILCRRWFDPVAQGQRLRRELAALRQVDDSVTDPGPPFTFYIGATRSIVTPEGRCVLELLRHLERDRKGHVINDPLLLPYDRLLGNLYREWSRHRIQSVVGLLAGGEKPLQVAAAGVVIALLINRSTSQNRALRRFPLGAARDVVDQAFFEAVRAFVRTLSPKQRPTRDPRLISGWMLYEARRRLGGDVLIVEGAHPNTDGRIWIEENKQDQAIEVVARDLGRGHRARVTAELLSKALDDLVVAFRSQTSRLAGFGPSSRETNQYREDPQCDFKAFQAAYWKFVKSIRSIFKLAEELALAHEQSAPGNVTVIPVIVDDLPRVLPVLQALCEIAEGRMFYAAEHALQTSVPATPDVVRRKAIETALSPADDPAARRVVLHTPDPERIDARYEPPAGADPSTGERAVLAVARAVAHREFDDRELALIAYSESGIDYPFRRGLWSLAVDHLAGLPNSSLRTLIFVAEAAIDIDLHCQKGRGFRYALQDSRLLRRNHSDDLRVAAHLIATYPQPVVFFLGAGFGASSLLPLGNALRDTAIRRLLAIPDDEPTTSQGLGLRFHRWVSGHEGWLSESEMAMREDDYANQLTLEQVIRIEQRVSVGLPTLQAFRVHHDEVIDAPGGAALDLSHVLARMVGRAIVVEVNFDQLVERHCPVPTRVFFSNAHFQDAAQYVREYVAGAATAIPVLKLHGSIEEPDTCVVSDEQMQQGIGRDKLQALQALWREMPEPPFLWVYIGASMRDRDLRHVFRAEAFVRGVEERWVSPYLDVSVADVARDHAALWAKPERTWIGERLITETADAFFRAMRDELP